MNSNTREIPLTQGKVSIVDADDYYRLSKSKWYHNCGYAIRRATNTEKQAGFGERVRMHRLIIDCPEGMEIDHIDGNGLNNQKSNLRVCTRLENIHNIGKNRKNTSGYKGVYLDNKRQKWFAKVQKKMPNGKKVDFYSSAFDKREDAALAYNYLALKHLGGFARLNVIEKGICL